MSMSGEPFCCADVLVRIRTFARYKNDFHLGPFATDSSGVCSITKQDMLAEERAHLDTGLMDYTGIGDCFSLAELLIYSEEEISRAIECRKKIWTSLLAGESKRWKSIEELITLYERALIVARTIIAGPMPMRVEWSEPAENREYSFVVSKRGKESSKATRSRWRLW
jgi:hypothetical protein